MSLGGVPGDTPPPPPQAPEAACWGASSCLLTWTVTGWVNPAENLVDVFCPWFANHVAHGAELSHPGTLIFSF